MKNHSNGAGNKSISVWREEWIRARWIYGLEREAGVLYNQMLQKLLTPPETPLHSRLLKS